MNQPTVKLQDLRPDDKNANRGTKRGRHLVSTSIHQYGAGRSILIDRDGRIGGLVDMFQGPQHTKGEGSGVANALAYANHKQNSLSRYLMGFGQLAKGAGSMMFADAGGMGGFDNALMKSDMSSGMASFLSNFTSGLGFATGGDVPYGGVFPVGELGPEKVFLPRGSHVVPNKDIGHGGQVLNIDARGTDPALTKANVARAIASSNAHAVSQAQARMVDRQRRVPRG